MKWLGRLVVSFLAILVLLALGLLALIVTFDPNDHRERIAGLVSEQLGQSVRIEGTLALEVYPWLGISTGRIRIDNPPGFSENPMISAAGLNARAALMPLLRGEIVLDTLVFRDPQLRVEMDDRLGHNWSPLIERFLGAPAPEGEENTSTSAGPSPQSLTLAGIEIQNGRLVVIDPARDRQFELDDIQLAVGAVHPGMPVDFRLDSRLQVSRPETDARLTLSGRLLQDDEAILLIKPRLRLEGTAKAPLPERIELTLDAEFAQTLPDSGSYLVGDSRLTASASALPRLSYLDLAVETQMTGNWRTGLHRLENVQSQALLRGLPIRSGELDLGIQSGITLDLSDGTARLDDLVLTTDPLVLRGQFDIAGLDKPAGWRLSGPMEIEPFSPRALADTLGQPLPSIRDETALRQFSLSGHLDAETGKARLSEARLSLDDQHFDGEIAIGDERPRHIRAALSTSWLDMDRYLPATEEEPATDPLAGAHRMPRGLGGSRAERLDQPAPLPVELLRSLDAEIRLSADLIRVFEQNLENLTVVFRGRDGQLAFERLDFNAYRGLIRSQSELDLRADIPGWRLAMDARHVALAPMLEAWLLEDRLRGTADLTLDLQTTGRRPSAMKAGLDGHLAFSVKDGRLDGVDLGEYVTAQRAPDDLPRIPRLLRETDIQTLSGTARIRNGLLENEDLAGTLDGLPIRGRGMVDLARDQIDYRLAIAPEDAQGQDDRLSATDLILLRGRLAHPQPTFEPSATREPGIRRLPAL